MQPITKISRSLGVSRSVMSMFCTLYIRVRKISKSLCIHTIFLFIVLVAFVIMRMHLWFLFEFRCCFVSILVVLYVILFISLLCYCCCSCISHFIDAFVWIFSLLKIKSKNIASNVARFFFSPHIIWAVNERCRHHVYHCCFYTCFSFFPMKWASHILF